MRIRPAAGSAAVEVGREQVGVPSGGERTAGDIDGYLVDGHSRGVVQTVTSVEDHARGLARRDEYQMAGHGERREQLIAVAGEREVVDAGEPRRPGLDRPG